MAGENTTNSTSAPRRSHAVSTHLLRPAAEPLGHSSQPTDAAFGPASFWLGAGLLLTGIGTVVLGPLLPHLSMQLQLTDADGGRLLAAKFIGAFLGGITTRNARFGIVLGGLLAAAGFSLLGFAATFAVAAAALAISGYGIGQMITAINILAGRRYTAHTGSALTLLNFFWSVGALLCGAAVALLLPSMGLRWLMLAYAGLLLLVAAAGELQKSGAADWRSIHRHLPNTSPRSLPRGILFTFMLVLFFYGGLETCLSDWITTFAQRYGGAHQLLDGQSAVILLWTAIAFGRLLASGLLRRVPERAVALVAILGTVVFASTLLGTHSGARISSATLLTGIFMASYFPTMFAQLMRWRPLPQQAGAIIAVSGLGAAGFLWLTGAISTHAHSLRVGMVVPLALAAALAVITALLPAPPASGTPQLDGV